MLRFVTSRSSQTDDHRLQMSSMIDIVFLLLVFFVMTFRITSQEGEFVMAGADAIVSDGESRGTNLPLILRLDASPEGRLIAISLNGQRATSFEEVQARLIGLEEDGALRDVVMTVDCDSKLKYENVIAALDNVTGYRDELGQLRPLIRSTKFANRH
ncbi:MAG: biopolymer transporter ExbD [Planctomycetes bacterium]|nr:biopolymer transporter ExbD [Planctomycetota bacterium]